METSLHRDLKKFYAASNAQTEVRIGGYRIDVVADGELIEIQHGSLSAIRDKVRRLLEDHRVTVVKPIVARKLLIKQSSKSGRVVSERLSPKRGTLLDIFEELVYFTRVFPHPRLALEVVLVEIEERRYPGHGRRRRWRRNDHVVDDQKLVLVGERSRLHTARDLLTLLPGLPARFHSGQLADLLRIERNVAQRIAYCLRETGAVQQAGREGNTRIYQVPPVKTSGRRRRAA